VNLCTTAWEQHGTCELAFSGAMITGTRNWKWRKLSCAIFPTSSSR
jgi:hypothetical protein